jgi:hypothetical protein
MGSFLFIDREEGGHEEASKESLNNEGAIRFEDLMPERTSSGGWERSFGEGRDLHRQRSPDLQGKGESWKHDP